MVRIENVLRGDVPRRTIALYYFAFRHLNAGHHPLIFGKAPSRRLIALRTDGAVYRTVLDGWNCAPLIVTGAHPGYRPEPDSTLAHYEVDLNTTRGEGLVDSGAFSSEIEEITSLGGEEGFLTEKLRRLVLTESGPVRAAACTALARYGERGADGSVRERAREAMGTGCR
jgi:hypothetical protein